MGNPLRYLIALTFLFALGARGSEIQTSIPRPEYPKPQFEPDQWLNLNGQWTYAFDFGRSGMDRELFKSKGFENTIIVPFCPESKLSGVAHTDFINAMWYHRQVKIPDVWKGKMILLHFGGVDFFCELFVNGKSAGKHWGARSEQREHWTMIKEAHDRLMHQAYDITKMLDPTRPVNETSGFIHVKTDLYTVHNYDQNPEGLQRWLENSGKGLPVNYPELEVPYAGQPYIVDEYGGIKWIASQEKRFSVSSWGYGSEPKTVEEYYQRLDSLTNVLLGFDTIAGYCYTQLTDVEQEQNGIYNYDRTPKFDMSRIRSVFSRMPAGKK
jgi:hypothetical protein